MAQYLPNLNWTATSGVVQTKRYQCIWDRIVNAKVEEGKEKLLVSLSGFCKNHPNMSWYELDKPKTIIYNKINL